MTPLFDLGEGLTMRPVAPEDHALLGAWIAADPEHGETCDVAFFSEHSPMAESYLVEDGEGAVFFLKLTRTTRLDVQFGPDSMRDRTRHGLVKGFPGLAALLRKRHFAELVTDSKNPRLMRALEKRLGFKRVAGGMRRTLGKG